MPQHPGKEHAEDEELKRILGSGTARMAAEDVDLRQAYQQHLEEMGQDAMDFEDFKTRFQQAKSDRQNQADTSGLLDFVFGGGE